MWNRKIIFILLGISLYCTTRNELEIKKLSFKDSVPSDISIQPKQIEIKKCASTLTTLENIFKEIKNNDPKIIGFYDIKIEYYPEIGFFVERNCIELSAYPVYKK